MKRKQTAFPIITLVGVFALSGSAILVLQAEPLEITQTDADAIGEITQRRPAVGPLRVGSANPRYFTDGNGKATYLTGSHTWNNFQDTPHPKLDYVGYLRLLGRENHNFMRLWVWEQAAWAPWTTDMVKIPSVALSAHKAGNGS